ncbi:hypothetical protein CGMCC3_g13744 [Colletotrichum fructicola]|nr:uncharacterized protein CGMCC3_g13744 [Colletotrichum fructicola]KAE9570171.1 hypothetical protein CGMCC3_g13744 [Colletotrichum fructicola]
MKEPLKNGGTIIHSRAGRAVCTDNRKTPLT